MDEQQISKSLRDFIVNVVNTSLKAEVLSFLYYNPFALFSASMLARALGREQQQIEECLQDLVAAGIIEQITPQGAYKTTTSSKKFALIKEFMRLYTKPEGKKIFRKLLEESFYYVIKFRKVSR